MIKDDFIKSYSIGQKLFPQAKIYQPFGLGVNTNNELFLSMGTYFKKENTFCYRAFAPYNFEQVEYNSQLKILTLHSIEFDFSIRLYNVSIDSISDLSWSAIYKKDILPQSSEVCGCGKLIKDLQAFSAYIELYTESENSVLFDLVPRDLTCFSDDFLYNYYVVNCLDLKSATKSLLDIQKEESIKYMNSFLCYKYDKIKEKNLYFFSYSTLN